MYFLLLSLAIACSEQERTAIDLENSTESADETGTANTESGGANGGNANAESDEGRSDQGCESDLGTFAGQIVLDLEWGAGPEPTPFARVSATPSKGEPITISSDDEGRFTTPLPSDQYLIMAEGSRCVSGHFLILLEPCESET